MTVVQARMLPWTWQDINSCGHAQGQCGAGLGHDSGRRCRRKRPCFNKYIVVPSSSITTQERVKLHHNHMVVQPHHARMFSGPQRYRVQRIPSMWHLQTLITSPMTSTVNIMCQWIKILHSMRKLDLRISTGKQLEYVCSFHLLVTYLSSLGSTSPDLDRTLGDIPCRDALS